VKTRSRGVLEQKANEIAELMSAMVPSIDEKKKNTKEDPERQFDAHAVLTAKKQAFRDEIEFDRNFAQEEASAIMKERDATSPFDPSTSWCFATDLRPPNHGAIRLAKWLLAK